jgi:hypothetical protein
MLDAVIDRLDEEELGLVVNELTILLFVDDMGGPDAPGRIEKGLSHLAAKGKKAPPGQAGPPA